MLILTTLADWSVAGPPKKAESEMLVVSVSRSPEGDEQVWLKERGQQGKIFVGTIRRLSRQAPLWHWDNRNSRQLKKAFPVGFPPPGFAESLGESAINLTTGNGFYVSRDPFDSQSFGNHQWAVSPVKDLRTLEVPKTPRVSFLIGNHVWEVLNPLLATLKIDAIQVGGTPNWYNVISPDVLKDVHVTTATDVLRYLSEIQPSMGYLLMLRGIHPEIGESPIFRNAWQEAEDLERTFNGQGTDSPSEVDGREFSLELCQEIRFKLAKTSIHASLLVRLLRKGYGKGYLELDTLFANLREESLRILFFAEITQSSTLLRNESAAGFLKQHELQLDLARQQAMAIDRGVRCERLFF